MPKLLWWQRWVGKGSDRRGERETGWGGEEVVAGCHTALVASGWLGVVRGWLVSGVRAAEWTGGELEVAEQLLHLPGRWTPVQSTSNVGR